MNRATTSLPVPDSPCRQVVASLLATRVARMITSRQAADAPGAYAERCRRSTNSVAECKAFMINLTRSTRVEKPGYGCILDIRRRMGNLLRASTPTQWWWRDLSFGYPGHRRSGEPGGSKVVPGRHPTACATTIAVADRQ